MAGIFNAEPQPLTTSEKLRLMAVPFLLARSIDLFF
jgi:hypothetical protein